MRVGKNIHQALFFLLALLLPVQLGKHFWPEWSYVLGLRIDYLSPTVYLTDFLVLGILLSWIWERRKVPTANNQLSAIRKYWWFVAFFFFLLANCFFAQNQGAALYKLLKIAEFALLGLYVARNKNLLSIIHYPLSISVICSSLIAIAQFFKQSSLDNFFWWLGERTFNAGTPGIAKAIVSGRLIMRPYATFPHPNVLAGFILVGLILTLPFLFQKRKLFAMPALQDSFGMSYSLLAIGTIIVTFSRVVWLIGLGIGGWFLVRRLFKGVRRKTLSIVFYLLLIASLGLFLFFRLPFSTEEAISQRLQLIKASLLMIKKYPLVGVGLNNFIVRLPEFWQRPEMIRLLQPVHNIFLLVTAETGLVGLAIFLWFLFLTFKNLIFAGRKPRTVSSEMKAKKTNFSEEVREGRERLVISACSINLLKKLRTFGPEKFIKSLFAMPALQDSFGMRYSLFASLIAILLLGLFDHYWFTLQQTQLLLAIVLGLSWSSSLSKIKKQ